MRDIRADLRERLEAAQEAEQAARDRVRLLKQMLEAEDARMMVTPNGSQARVTITGLGTGEDGALTNFSEILRAVGTPTISLDDYLLKAVRRGVSDKDELRDAAIRDGYFPPNGTRSPGRVIHAKLLHLLKDGKLQKNDDGFIAGGE